MIINLKLGITLILTMFLSKGLTVMGIFTEDTHSFVVFCVSIIMCIEFYRNIKKLKISQDNE